jgi:hypothetical protein
VSVCAPVHDALHIEAPIGELDLTIALTRESIAEAPRGELEIATDVSVIAYPTATPTDADR